MNNRDYSSTPPRKYPVAAADTLRTSHELFCYKNAIWELRSLQF